MIYLLAVVWALLIIACAYGFWLTYLTLRIFSDRVSSISFMVEKILVQSGRKFQEDH